MIDDLHGSMLEVRRDNGGSRAGERTHVFEPKATDHDVVNGAGHAFPRVDFLVADRIEE